MRWWNEGQQPYVDGFSWDPYNRDSFDEVIEMRGKTPYANFKTACFVQYLSTFC